MQKEIHFLIPRFFNPRTLIVFLLCTAAACSILIPTRSGAGRSFIRKELRTVSQRTLSLEEARVLSTRN